jgi:predicted PurR-regulated permease PerM
LLLALFYFDVPELVDKLSFSLTLSSLLLAILAIFYTIISANKQDINLTKIIETNSDLKSAAKTITNVSQTMDTALNEFPSHFRSIRSKIDTLTNNFSVPSPDPATLTNY